MKPTAPLTPEQRATLTEHIGDAKAARTSLVMSFGTAVRDRRIHNHLREDWFCLNLAAYIGERTGPMLRRLLDTEADARRNRIAWQRARTRALALASAADRYATRSRDLQAALQEAVFACVGLQIEQRGAAAELHDLLNQCSSGKATAVDLAAAVKELADRWREDITTAQSEPPHCDCYAAPGRFGLNGYMARAGEHDPQCNTLVSPLVRILRPLVGKALHTAPSRPPLPLPVAHEERLTEHLTTELARQLQDSPIIAAITAVSDENEVLRARVAELEKHQAAPTAGDA